MYSTRVTKLKKTAGAVVYNYDVYIGPEIKTAHGHWTSQCGIIPSSFPVDH